MADTTRSPLDRALDKVEVGGAEDCWPWTGGVSGRYGLIRMEPGAKHINRVAHRVIYEGLVEPVPADLKLDHLCRNTLCCNPDHLEPVPHGENVRRGRGSALKTHCKAGHPYAENAFDDGGGARRCRICRQDQLRRADLKRKGRL